MMSHTIRLIEWRFRELTSTPLTPRESALAIAIAEGIARAAAEAEERQAVFHDEIDVEW